RVRVAEQREVDVRRPPPEGVVLPWIGAGLDRPDPVTTLVLREHLPFAEEVRIQRRLVVVHGVRIFPGRIGLPYLDERPSHRSPVLVEETADEYHLLSERSAPPPGREVGLALLHELLREDRPRGLERARRHSHQRLRRRPEPRALVVGVQVRRVEVSVWRGPRHLPREQSARP